jgi:5-methylcytosine-specific restriction protein B
MREILKNILEKYPNARATTSFGGQHEIRSLFESLKESISSLEFIKNNQNLLVKYSYGKGNWAETSWIAILDERETTTTQKGTYVVILFRGDGDGCHLKLGQGVTEITGEFGNGANAVGELQRRAQEVRNLFPEMLNTAFDSEPQEMRGQANLTALYEASTIYSKYYKLNSMPSDEELSNDVEALVNCYEEYVERKDMQLEAVKESGRKIWAIALGQGGRLWDESYEKGIVCIGWDELGDLSKYESKEAITTKLLEFRGGPDSVPSNDALCCFQFVHEMKVGDLVVAKVGRKKILGGGVVTSEYIYDHQRKEYQSIRKVNWLTAEKAEFPGTGVTTKTLTEISRYPTFKEMIESYIEGKSIVETIPLESYGIKSALKDLLLSKEDFEEMLESLLSKKNLILQGPPGTGKSFVAKRLAYALLGFKDDSRIESVQFHQSFSYEDFIQGFRPKKDGSGFSLKDGVFYRFCKKALHDPDRPYVFIIDEINRGNLSKIFGEVMLLIETDKRGPDWAVSLTYSDESASKFHIPANVHILGMMNTADRSLAIVDYALRRRFAFKDVLPGFDSDKFRPLLESKGVEPQVIAAIQAKMAALNKEIESSVDLGRGFTIGHSFFVPFENVTNSKAWYDSVIKNEIVPLLREYWFDKKQSEVDQHVQSLSL